MCDFGGTNCGTIGQNGTGVENADYILYVSADVQASSCADPESLVLAFSSACQLEIEYDRYMCPCTYECTDMYMIL